MKLRRILVGLSAGLLLSGALVAVTASAADAFVEAEYAPLVDQGSRKCLTVLPNANGILDNGQRVVQQSCNGSAAQGFRCFDFPNNGAQMYHQG